MRITRWGRVLTLTLVAGMGAACETGTEPAEDPSFDAEAALLDYAAMDSLLASDAMAGFRAMAGGVTLLSFPEEMEVAALVGAELERVVRGEYPTRMTRRFMEMAEGARGDPSRSPIISPLRRGTTFVFDPALGRYVMDPSLDGAPETGVRFLLYEEGPDGRPDPQREIGYVDLIDEGAGSAEDIALRVVVVTSGDVLLDYRTTVDVVESGGAVTVEGFLQGEEDRLDFEITIRGSTAGGESTADITFEMGIGARGFQISGSMHGVDGDTGEGGRVDLSVRHGSDSFSVEIQGNPDHLEGTFRVNGEVFATLEGHPDSAVIRGATGEEPTWAEVLVLRHIVDLSEDVFDLFEDLLDPLDEIVVLAIIL